MTNLETLTEASKRLGKTASRLRQLCNQGLAKDAIKVGGIWFVPETWKPDTRRYGQNKS